MKLELKGIFCGVSILLSTFWLACGTNTDAGTGGTTSASTSIGSGKSTTSGSDTSTSTGPDPFAGCQKGTLEADRVDDVPLMGPGVDQSTSTVTPGHYVIAATYLALIPSQKVSAKELGGAVIGTLPSMKGLVAYAIEESPSCATLRTLTAWDSEEDMMAFVMSEAHAKAMAQFSTLSRGSSNVLSWDGDEKDVSWAAAASHLAAQQGGDQ